jgi:hypothetical protein
MSQTAWRADPLVWGHGPRVFEVFLEPTCPFSVKAFGKLDDLLAQAGKARITIKIRLSIAALAHVLGRDLCAAFWLPLRSRAGRKPQRLSWRRWLHIVKNSNSTAIVAVQILT